MANQPQPGDVAYLDRRGVYIVGRADQINMFSSDPIPHYRYKHRRNARAEYLAPVSEFRTAPAPKSKNTDH